MKRIKVVGMIQTLVLLAGMVFTTTPVSAQLESIYEQSSALQLANGLTYEAVTKLTEEGLVDLYVLSMDLTEPYLDLKVLRDDEVFGASEQVSDMSDAEGTIIGGINGSFFSMGAAVGEVLGIEVENETITYAIDDYNYYSDNAANLVIQDDLAWIDYLSISMTLQTQDGKSVRIQGVNTRSVGGEPVLFNRQAYETTETINQLADLYKVVVEDGMVIEVIDDDTVVEIPEDGYVVVFKKEDAQLYLSSLDVGTSVHFKTVTNFELEDMALAIPGGGFLIKDGQTVSEGLQVAANKRHPRTAVGLTEDGQTLIAMVVDGRGNSIGATQEELAAYMKGYGVYNAIQMDGGGSSTLVVREPGEFETEVVNTTSDGSERAVVNGLGISLNAPETDEFSLILEGDQDRVFVNNKVKLSLKAVDLNFNPVEVDEDMVAWSMSGGYGVIEDMTFTPKVAGDIVLMAQYKGQTRYLELTVVDTLIDLEIVPKAIHYDDGIQNLTVIGTDEDGYKSVIDNTLLSWSLSEDVGTILSGTFYPGENPGNARIDVKYQGIKEVAYVVSGSEERDLLDLSKTAPTTLVYPETVQGEVRSDDGVVTFDYNFEPSEVAQALYAVFEKAKITSSVDTVALSMEGDLAGITIKAHMTDADGEDFTLTFDENLQAQMPSVLAYPVSINRIYVLTFATEEAKTGELRMDRILGVKKTEITDLDDVLSIPPVDELMNTLPEAEVFTLKIFGATGGRNRLLDEVVMDKLYETFNQADYAVYAGASDIDVTKVKNDALIYDNNFQVVDLDEARVITLAMSEGSLVKTDSSQWAKLESAMAQAVQGCIVIIGTEKLIDNSDASFTKEGEMLHEMISSYVKKSGKTLFYINASGYDYNLSYYEGIRYIDLNGLWYKVGSNHEVDLYDSFQMISLYMDQDGVTYNVESLFPKTKVSD